MSRSERNSTGRDIHKDLHQWMTQEMHFHPQGQHINAKVPSPEALKGITCGPLKDVWEFVLNHVHSTQTVKKVKGNLALKGKQSQKYKVQFKSDKKYDSEKQELLEERAQITGEVTHMLTDINHLANDVKRIEQEIEGAAEKVSTVSNDVDDWRHKSTLLQAYTQQCKDTVAMHKEFTNRIDTRIQKITSQSKKHSDTEYYSKKHSSNEDDQGSTGLETKADKHIRETCSSVGEFLHKVLQGSFGREKEQVQRNKELLWKDIDKVMTELSPHQMYNALILHAQDSALAIREATHKIDIRGDAEQIRFKFERSGELCDLSNPPSLLESVHQLIEETQMNHIMRFMETEKHKNVIWKKEQQLNDLKMKVDKRLNKSFTNAQQLKAARLYIETEVEIAGKRSSLSSYIDQADALQERIACSVKDKEILTAKYQQIQDFQIIADKKQNLIRVLIKQNANSRPRLQEQQSEIDQYIKRSLMGHETELKSLSSSLKGSVASEVDQFVTLQLPYLLLTTNSDSLFRVAILDLSINLLGLPTSTAVRKSLDKVCKDIGFPHYKAAECLLSTCMDRKLCIQKYLSQLQHWDEQDILAGSSSSDKETLAHIKDLCKEVEEHDKKLLGKSLPALQQRIDNSVRSLKDCINVEIAIEDWWNQPAQYLVPWVFVSKHNVQQWIDRWTVIVTSLRQLIINKQEH